jgi:hypothetical protein
MTNYQYNLDLKRLQLLMKLDEYDQILKNAEMQENEQDPFNIENQKD